MWRRALSHRHALSTTATFAAYCDAPTAAPPSTPSAPPPPSASPAAAAEEGCPFVYPALTAGTRRRHGKVRQLARLQRYAVGRMAELGAELARGDLDEKAYGGSVQGLKESVAARANLVNFGAGVDVGAREAYLTEYGCARWTPAALRIVARRSPLIEIGAGAGQWQRVLAEAGADVLAFDSMVDLPLPPKQTEATGGKVFRGTEEYVLVWGRGGEGRVVVGVVCVC
jgi:hypothetical protein